MKTIKVNDIIAHLHKIADPKLSYDWDNAGFQLGDADQEVKKILLTLDVTKNAIGKAIRENVDLIISHHPFIFRPMKKVTNPLFLKLIKNNISVLSAHTNLDVIKNGVNFALAKKLGLSNLTFLSQDTNAKLFQLAVYVPKSYSEQVKKAVLKNAGKIGNYDDCLNEYSVEGQFKPHENSDPTIGERGKLKKVSEQKLEFFVDSIHLQKVIAALKKVHPYETPVYAVFPQERASDNFGLGLIGDLEENITLTEFAKFVKQSLQAPFVKLWKAGKPDDFQFSRIAICGGTGTSLLSEVYGRADVFVSADFTYHTIIDSKVPLIDAGHFYTENPVLENLKEMLSEFDFEIIELTAAEHEISDLWVL